MNTEGHMAGQAMGNLEHLRYPVGRMPRSSAPLDVRTREDYLGILEAMPATVRNPPHKSGGSWKKVKVRKMP